MAIGLVTVGLMVAGLMAVWVMTVGLVTDGRWGDSSRAGDSCHSYSGRSTGNKFTVSVTVGVMADLQLGLGHGI